MTNLMCRGRKRGLAGAIATQRLAKLAKNVAAEASNFLMGRTFLDIDMARAADLLGMERRQAERIRDLERGCFLGLGPAISRRPVTTRIGATRTTSRTGTHKLLPMPEAQGEDLRDMLLAAGANDAPVPMPPPRPAPVAADELIGSIAPAPLPMPEQSAMFAARKEAEDAADAIDAEAVVVAVLTDMLADGNIANQTEALLYQDFSVRCRMQRLIRPPLDMEGFRQRLALARGGILDPADPACAPLLEAATRLPQEMYAPFLLIARAAMDGQPCPDDAALGRAYGTSSPGRIRRLIEYMEKQGVIVVRADFGGRRSIGIPDLGLSTGAE
jgi:hypothetical protein